ncbi:hypothetical protein B7R54_03260 [Subtercola boreus]|uniref:Uncharacterized protein n=1 Tax=Subtercola boreus TaxID=120213 RepID=A0A3E0VEK1_9MICO|nr:hypothetical protein B7R54_03260 [Subtercola boreus]
MPTVTATAAPAPVIELPFYPPPSAGTARDAFPFVLAGIAAGAVLILGVVAYLVSRRRLGRIRFAPAVGGRPVGTVRVGQSSEPIAGNLQLPWASTPTQAVDGAAPAAFALGFAPLETGARPSDAVAYDAAFESPPVESRSPRETTSGFFSVFARLRRGGVAATEPVSYSVFEPLTPRPVPEKQQTFGLSFGKRNPPPDAAGSFDLGLPAL